MGNGASMRLAVGAAPGNGRGGHRLVNTPSREHTGVVTIRGAASERAKVVSGPTAHSVGETRWLGRRLDSKWFGHPR